MVVGLDVKFSLMLIPATMFFYVTAILNPVIILKCVGPHCRDRMHSEFDTKFDGFKDYKTWRNGSANLQSDGNVTLLRFSHGYVICDWNCDDCEGKDHASETCTDYNDTAFEHFRDEISDYNETLPKYLVPDCKCREWCLKCDDYNLVSLPGDEDGKHRHMQNYWDKLVKHCEEWEEELGSQEGVMCNLFDTFTFTMTLTIAAFVWLGGVLVLIMFMEYTNFHLFYGGKCKVCFISTRLKKIIFTLLLIAPLSFMMYIGMILWYGDTELLLTKYFDLIGAEFVYDWKTRGVITFFVSMGLAALSIVVMMLSGTTVRHERTIANYRRGVEYPGVYWKPHMN
jgi:hypothetical protein